MSFQNDNGEAKNLKERILKLDSEVGNLIHQHDWENTPLGAIENWPQSLQIAVSICLFSRFPMFVWWGKDLIMLYNDAYRPILGTEKHPYALGRPGQESWAEIWDIIGPMAEGVYREGKATWSSDQMLLIDRYGFTEESYFTFSYSPIFDESGAVGGVFTAVTETTQQILSQRRLKTLHDLGEQSKPSKSAEEACLIAAKVLDGNQADIPFSLIYLLDENQHEAQLVCQSGTENSSLLSLSTIQLADSEESFWPLSRVLEKGEAQLVEGLASRFEQHFADGSWTDAPDKAFILPISSGLNRTIGFLILGVSPRLLLDEAYRNFYKLVVGHIATAISNARAYEDERKRAEALAEIDRAKTEFFSNVSHEFRTPLTLMLNPLQEILRSGDNLSLEQRDNLDMAHRNGLRLLKLVNTLLDFSRIQSNRIRASFEPTDLASLTEDLASNFRSVIERAGLKLTVDCEPMPELVYVDREMWEKIVLNLISNAFKFTFDGEIEVSLKAFEKYVELKVRDSGIGISESDLEHIFERFHRVRGARSRSHEGSGIGLALVAQLVHFHGGKIEVSSETNQGTSFMVSIPLGSGHLPQEQVQQQAASAQNPYPAAASYTEEAQRWLSSTQEVEVEAPLTPFSKYDTGITRLPLSDSRSEIKILIADDNADMRDYLQRLLAAHYQVEAVSDGSEALKRILAAAPALIIADVMMPKMDGFALLRHLRSDLKTRSIPVILLSARAGEEARIEGLQAGADDYMTKPFSARELLARIEGQLLMAQLRGENQTTIEDIIESISDPFYVLDHNWQLIYANQRAQEMWGKSREEVIGKHIGEIFLQGIGHQVYKTMLEAVERRRSTSFEIHSPSFERWYEVRIYPSRKGIAVYFRDIHERKQVEEKFLRVQTQLDSEQQHIISIFESISDAFASLDKQYRYTYLNPKGLELAYRLSGKSQEELIGEVAWNSFPGLFDSPLGHEIRRAMESNTPTQVTSFFPPLDAWFDVRSYPARDGLSIYFADVTEQEKTRQALEETEQRLLLAQEAGQVGIWDWNGLSNETYWTAMMWRLYGLEPRTTEKTDALWESMLHHEDKKRVTEKITQILESQENNYQDSFRIIRPDGLVRWITSKGRIFRNETGEAVRMAGINIDITESKKREAQLRETEEQLRMMIDSAKDYAIFSLDIDGNVTTWNTGAERIFGFTAEEILGNTGEIIFTPEDRANAIPVHEQNKAVELGYAVDERWHLRKDGSRFFASGMMRPMRDDAGHLQGFIKVARDMTHAKLHEDPNRQN